MGLRYFKRVSIVPRLLERTLDDIRAAREAAGVEFTNGDQPGVRLKKGQQAMQRKKLPAQEIEALCVAALKCCMGLHEVISAKIRPYRGEKSWTWELRSVDPEPPKLALEDAMPEINKLQQLFDLDGASIAADEPNASNDEYTNDDGGL
jgi:hypothetical protein